MLSTMRQGHELHNMLTVWMLSTIIDYFRLFVCLLIFTKQFPLRHHSGKICYPLWCLIETP